jgi:hypothetical protein
MLTAKNCAAGGYLKRHQSRTVCRKRYLLEAVVRRRVVNYRKERKKRKKLTHYISKVVINPNGTPFSAPIAWYATEMSRKLGVTDSTVAKIT